MINISTSKKKAAHHSPEELQIKAIFSVAYDFQKKGQYFKAIGAFQEVLRRDPYHEAAHNNLGNCLRSIGRFEESIQHYDAVVLLNPKKTFPLLNKGLALLALHRYEEAWPLYRHRLELIDFRREVLESGKPEWEGQELSADRNLFLYSNQGLGDELQILRYIPMVAERVKSITWEVQGAMYNLVKDFPGISDIVIRPGEGKELPDFDCQCEIFTLPGIFETSFTTIPDPYRPAFTPDLNVNRIISREREKFPESKHIGIVWSGNPKNDINPYRACGLVHLLPLLGVPNCRFYSLQKGAPRQDLETFSSQADHLFDLSNDLPDLASTATAIDVLDLVITTDTSVPHLAGTMGAESWVLLHQPSDWRWTTDRDRSPWYPQLKLFRQNRPGDWVELLERVRDELVEFASD